MKNKGRTHFTPGAAPGWLFTTFKADEKTPL